MRLDNDFANVWRNPCSTREGLGTDNNTLCLNEYGNLRGRHKIAPFASPPCSNPYAFLGFANYSVLV